MKLNLPEATFMVPYKFDTPDRVRNIEISVDYLVNNLNTNIIICEQNGDTVPESIKKLCYYVKMTSEHPILHDTRMTNLMAHIAKTPVIINYDCDILLPLSAYEEAYSLLINDQYDIVYPYRKFLDMSPRLLKSNVDEIDQKKLKVIKPEGESVGGVVFYKKDKYIESGMENEKVIGWGYADDERFHRFTKLGLRITRTENPLFHINHRGGMSNPFFQTNKQEFERIKNISVDELRTEIESWSWKYEKN